MWLRLFFALFLCYSQVVIYGQALPTLIPFTDGTKWGYADSLGKVIIPVQWSEVRFFSDHKATVLARKAYGRAQNNVYAWINEQGQYIIPPQAGWTGELSGSWAESRLNAIDSNGKRGIIDSNGQTILPYQWDNSAPMTGRLSDSFKIVYLDGLAGIVNRQGELIVPCKWAEISSTEELSSIGAFMVRDPDNAGGINSYGVADLSNRLIVPPRYSTISSFKLPNGKRVFHVSVKANNEMAGGYSYSNNSNAVAEKFLDYPSGRQIPAPENIPLANEDEQHLPGGYIVSREGLLDSNRKVLLPCCSFWKISGDTIFAKAEKRIGKDSVAFTISWLDRMTLKPLKPAYTRVLYKQDPPKEIQSYSGYSHSSGYYDRHEPTRILIPDFGEVEQFYKDTIQYSIQHRIPPENKYFLISGYARFSSRNYTAVIDSNFQYIIPPQADLRISSYNTRDGIAIVNGHSKRYNANGYSLINNDGIELMPPQKTEIISAFRWNDSIYLFTRQQDECDPKPSGTHIFLTDINGNLLSAFTALDVSINSQNNFLQYQNMPAGSIWVKDATGLTGIVFPDGRPVYPALNFKYKFVSPYSNHWFWVNDKDNTRVLIDASNNQIVKGMKVYSIEQTRKNYGLGQSYEDSQRYIPRLHTVNAKDAKGNNVYFFMDDTGHAYLKPL